MPNIAAGLAFTQDDCVRVISEAWGRYTGQPPTSTIAQNWRAPGFFGLTQRRRAHLFKLPTADPVLPTEMGEYPRFQSDMLRQKHWELVSRLLENRFSIKVTSSPDTQRAREMADHAEWVLTYGAANIQERTGVDWQRALAEGASAYGYGILHSRIAPELQAKTPDARYVDEVPAGAESDYQPSEEAVGGDTAKGKYRERSAVVASRTLRAKANAPFPFHVEVVAPDQAAFIDDESLEPGPGITVHIKEVGIIDYNGKLAKDGLRLIPSAGDAGNVKLSLEEFDAKTQVGLERPAPMGALGQSPSVAGWKQRIAIASLWNRGEYYELVSPSLLSGSSETIVNQTDWLLVKGQKQGYGRCPFYRGYATIEENEWDPALRYRPAQDGLYAGKASFDYTRALYDMVATRRAITTYWIEQDKDAPPILAGDEEGDQTILTRDSQMAQTLPPGQKLLPTAVPEMDAAFAKLVEMQLADLEASAPPTGQTPISATTQPWNLRIGQVMANAYPTLVLRNIELALAEMIRNWVESAAKPVEEGGLGIPLVAPGFKKNAKGQRTIDRTSEPISMEPGDWDGLWIDVEISPTSSAERVTQIQMGQELLNNPIHVTTPEQFVGDDLGVQDATGHMKEVDAYWAIQPFMQGKTNQILSEFYGKQVLVGADGVLANGLGKSVDPTQLLAQNGVSAVTPTAGGSALPGAAPPPLPSMPATGVMPAAPGMA